MNIVVTAGNTFVPIDSVRGITNRFTGTTGARIALVAHARHHSVTLCTSHPDMLASLGVPIPTDTPRWQVRPYHTFDELHALLAVLCQDPTTDALIHSAAVSDYRCTGVFDQQMRDRSASKIKSDEPMLWLRLERTPKLIDLVRAQWGFAGVLVKFKLEAGVSTTELLAIAERSRRQSQADLMVANTLEGVQREAYLGPIDGTYWPLSREQLPTVLIAAVESVAATRPRHRRP
jgi:phosphopantothenoylcysteine synthetase/decarboxylase